jgi:hypothetical protein
MKLKNIDIELILILSISFSALVFYLFDITGVYLRLLLLTITIVSFYVFYDTVKKLDIYDTGNEIGFKQENKYNFGF